MSEHYREKLSALGIPKAAVAGIAGISPAEFSLYLRDPMLLSEKRQALVRNAVEDCILIQTAAKKEFPKAVIVNWKDFQAVRELILWFKAEIESNKAQTFLEQLTEAQKEANVVIA